MAVAGSITAARARIVLRLRPMAILMLLVGWWSVAGAVVVTDAAAPLKPEEIVARMTANNAARAARLRAYRSTRTYELDYHGLPSHKSASMVVSAAYDEGQKKLTVVSEGGSKLLLDHVLRKILVREVEANDRENLATTALSPDNYEFTLLGMEEAEAGGNPCYAFRVKPRRRDNLLYQGKVWIDAQEFALVRIQAKPAKNPSFWISETLIEHEYRNTSGFWLPATNRSTSKVRFGGRAVLTIHYGDYEVTAK